MQESGGASVRRLGVSAREYAFEQAHARLHAQETAARSQDLF